MAAPAEQDFKMSLVKQNNSNFRAVLSVQLVWQRVTLIALYLGIRYTDGQFSQPQLENNEI